MSVDSSERISVDSLASVLVHEGIYDLPKSIVEGIILQAKASRNWEESKVMKSTTPHIKPSLSIEEIAALAPQYAERYRYKIQEPSPVDDPIPDYIFNPEPVDPNCWMITDFPSHPLAPGETRPPKPQEPDVPEPTPEENQALVDSYTQPPLTFTTDTKGRKLDLVLL
eukprot:Phypoly_transcript_14726.p1 GENE.Phypoly_transcript_14726~~Phypoly_transcript_14726.p1  ORF type:complete len:179 (+),score=21.66 Phypoly_transcript_14726:36-539(+)